MDTAIKALTKALSHNQRWVRAYTKCMLQRPWLLKALSSSKGTFDYFAHQESPGEQALAVLWKSLETHIGAYFHVLDSSGMSAIIGEVAPKYLSDASFSEATKFRHFEEKKLLKDLRVPEQAWDLFWESMDLDKGKLFAEMRKSKPFQFSLLARRVAKNFRKGMGTHRHLSPFNWWKATRVGLATVIGIADCTAAVPTAGVAVASIVTVGIEAGYEAGSE